MRTKKDLFLTPKTRHREKTYLSQTVVVSPGDTLTFNPGKLDGG